MRLKSRCRPAGLTPGASGTSSSLAASGRQWDSAAGGRTQVALLGLGLGPAASLPPTRPVRPQPAAVLPALPGRAAQTGARPAQLLGGIPALRASPQSKRVGVLHVKSRRLQGAACAPGRGGGPRGRMGGAAPPSPRGFQAGLKSRGAGGRLSLLRSLPPDLGAPLGGQGPQALAVPTCLPAALHAESRCSFLVFFRRHRSVVLA